MPIIGLRYYALLLLFSCLLITVRPGSCTFSLPTTWDSLFALWHDFPQPSKYTAAVHPGNVAESEPKQNTSSYQKAMESLVRYCSQAALGESLIHMHTIAWETTQDKSEVVCQSSLSAVRVMNVPNNGAPEHHRKLLPIVMAQSLLVFGSDSTRSLHSIQFALNRTNPTMVTTIDIHQWHLGSLQMVDCPPLTLVILAVNNVAVELFPSTVLEIVKAYTEKCDAAMIWPVGAVHSSPGTFPLRANNWAAPVSVAAYIGKGEDEISKAKANIGHELLRATSALHLALVTLNTTAVLWGLPWSSISIAEDFYRPAPDFVHVAKLSNAVSTLPIAGAVVCRPTIDEIGECESQKQDSLCFQILSGDQLFQSEQDRKERESSSQCGQFSAMLIPRRTYLSMLSRLETVVSQGVDAAVRDLDGPAIHRGINCIFHSIASRWVLEVANDLSHPLVSLHPSLKSQAVHSGSNETVDSPQHHKIKSLDQGTMEWQGCKVCPFSSVADSIDFCNSCKSPGPCVQSCTSDKFDSGIISMCLEQGWLPVPKAKPKLNIWEVFHYLNEDFVTQIRRSEIGHLIAGTVVIESTKTFRNGSKGLNSHKVPGGFGNEASFSRRVIIDDAPGFTENPWRREYHQRAEAKRGLFDMPGDDWVLFSDLDEIPRREVLQTLRDCHGQPEALAFAGRVFMHDTERMKDRWWHAPVLFKRSLMDQRFSFKKARLLGHHRLLPWWFDAAWHFTFFGSTGSVQYKIKSYSDGVKEELRSPSSINDRVSQKKHILGHDEELGLEKFIPRDVDLPGFFQSTSATFTFQNISDLDNGDPNQPAVAIPPLGVLPVDGGGWCDSSRRQNSCMCASIADSFVCTNEEAGFGDAPDSTVLNLARAGQTSNSSIYGFPKGKRNRSIYLAAAHELDSSRSPASQVGASQSVVDLFAELSQHDPIQPALYKKWHKWSVEVPSEGSASADVACEGENSANSNGGANAKLSCSSMTENLSVLAYSEGGVGWRGCVSEAHDILIWDLSHPPEEFYDKLGHQLWVLAVIEGGEKFQGSISSDDDVIVSTQDGILVTESQVPWADCILILRPFVQSAELDQDSPAQQSHEETPVDQSLIGVSRLWCRHSRANGDFGLGSLEGLKDQSEASNSMESVHKVTDFLGKAFHALDSRCRGPSPFSTLTTNWPWASITIENPSFTGQIFQAGQHMQLLVVVKHAHQGDRVLLETEGFGNPVAILVVDREDVNSDIKDVMEIQIPVYLNYRGIITYSAKLTDKHYVLRSQDDVVVKVM